MFQSIAIDIFYAQSHCHLIFLIEVYIQAPYEVYSEIMVSLLNIQDQSFQVCEHWFWKEYLQKPRSTRNTSRGHHALIKST